MTWLLFIVHACTSREPGFFKNDAKKCLYHNWPDQCPRVTIKLPNKRPRPAPLPLFKLLL